MNANSQHRNASADGAVLRWNGRVVTAEDLRQSLNGQRELVLSPRAVITPMAADHLRANGIRITREDETAKPGTQDARLGTATWGYAQERPEPLVGSVVQSLKRDGVDLKELSVPPRPARGSQSSEIDIACGLARQVAECVVRGECLGAVVFCQDPGLVCCVANKVKGVRAVPATSVPQSSRAAKALGANFLAVAISGRTFFELRQTLRALCLRDSACPESLAAVLKELEGPCQCQGGSGQTSESDKGKCQCGGGHAHR
jgi:hypothetical protein